MKKKTAGLQTDPWTVLTGQGTLTAVPLGQVFAYLQVPPGEARSVKRGMLASLTRLTEAAEKKN